MSNQSHKRFLNYIASGFRPPAHVQGKAVQSALMTPVKLQESGLVTRGEPPHEFNIAWFGYVCHLL
jgi:hypothetical protein